MNEVKLAAAQGSATFRRVLRANRLLAESGHPDLQSALVELARLRDGLRRIKKQTQDFERYSLPGTIHHIASEALSPNKAGQT